ncbi:16129_t:CDS:1, partial [Gigaspora rosea]
YYIKNHNTIYQPRIVCDENGRKNLERNDGMYWAYWAHKNATR